MLHLIEGAFPFFALPFVISLICVPIAAAICLKGVRSGKQPNGSSWKDSADGRSGRFRRLYDFNGLFFALTRPSTGF